MKDKADRLSGWKKILIAALIVVDIVLLVIAVITIPPNLMRMTASVFQQETPLSTKDSTDLGVPAQDDPSNSATDTQAPTSEPEQRADDRVGNGTALSTTERPDLGDFLWYSEDVFYSGVPEGTSRITELDSVYGDWKAFIYYDPDNSHGFSAMEFLNMNISGSADTLNVTLDWYQIYWANEGESYDESSFEDTLFTGQWENDGLWASGAGTIRLTELYELNNAQYAVGTMDTPDGIPAFVALVRP